MVRRDRAAVRRPRLLTPLAALLTVGAATFVVAAPSAADVSEVGGGAFGYSAKVSLFGGPEQARGPAPSVSLPGGGSASPVTASDPSGKATFGPATIFESGPLAVSTKGTTGPNGSVESSATVTGVPGGPGPVLYGELKSSCTAREGEVSGSATVTGGTLETKYNADTQQPVETRPVPSNPAPNTEFTGTIDHVGDRFRVVYNEQVRSGNGITVNAAHLYLLGPNAVGELIIGQSRCSASAGPPRAAGSAQATTTTRSQGRPAAGATTTTRAGGGGQTGGGSSTTGDNMPNTGADVLPLVIMASAFVVAGAIVLVDDPRRSLRPRRGRGRP
ncbi:MAG TPA: hypothetical protein VHG90_03850 [Acidimicrobiales bacterium]|nr:hypothetical protein [Acidimicrobiales bacterium]